MTKRIAILGCGWLGLPLGARLVEIGYSVKGSTTSPEKQAQLRAIGIAPYVFSVGSDFEGKVADFFAADILILNIPPGRRNPNVEVEHPKQVRLIIEEAIKGGIQQLIFISSSSVYGSNNQTVTETTPPDPETASGRALVKAEEWLCMQPISTTIIRMAGLYGLDRNPARFLAGKKDLKNGSAPINLVHQQEAIEAIVQVIQREKWNDLYNICADDHPSRAAYYTAKAKEFGLTPPTFTMTGEVSFKILNNEKAKRELGITFQPLFP